ncbi:MAG: SPOR domain-containing protein [Ferrimonas sp.]
MARDYVRKPNAKRARTPSKGASKPSASSFSWATATVLVALVCFDGYGLLSIKGASDEQALSSTTEQAVQPTTEVPPPKAPKAERPLPQMPPKTTWTYEETLPNRVIEVEVAEQQQGGPYHMQCGSFRQQEQAESMRATIAFVGLEAQVQRSDGSNGVWYRVVLGPYDSRRQGQMDAHRLQQININTCRIW